MTDLNNYKLALVLKNGRDLQYIDEKTYNLCLNAVQQNGTALEFVTDQTYRLCIAAVKQTKYALEYVNIDKVTSEEYFRICLCACQHIDPCIHNVKKHKLTSKQYYEVCLTAIIHGCRDPFSVINNNNFSDHQYFNLSVAAIKRVGIYVRHVKAEKLTVNQYRELCKIAINKDAFAKRYVSAPLPLGDPTVVIDVEQISQT